MSVISYSSYKNDLLSFNIDEYIQNLHSSISEYEKNNVELFNNFMKNYKDIENEDFKKPIFSQTSKFKKIPNNLKNYKYLKINRDDEPKNTWNFSLPKNELEKISIIVKSYLNKITDTTYKKISVEFINEILLIQNNMDETLFEILSKELLSKCLFDTKYRSLYINLCSKIWTNKQLHYNIVHTSQNNNNHFWQFKSGGKMNGPFTNETDMKNDIYIKTNFKIFFINYIQKLYKQQDLEFDNLNDEEIFIKKKKIFVLVELIVILYTEKYINFDIINIIIIDLLHINNKLNEIKDVEYESLYNLLKLIKELKTNYNDLMQYKIIFEEFKNIIENIINNKNLSKRSLFFLNEIIILFELFSTNNELKSNIPLKQTKSFEKKENNISSKGGMSRINSTNSVNSVNSSINKNKNNNNNNNNNHSDTELKNLFVNNIKENSYNDLINIYNRCNINDREYLMNKTLELFIDDRIINKYLIQFINDTKDGELFYKLLDKIITNIDDIILDVPDVNIKIINLLENTIFKNNRKGDIIIKLNSMIDDLDEDKNNSDDDNSAASEDF